jgi:uncharacterized damage-inducible protein DinB
MSMRATLQRFRHLHIVENLFGRTGAKRPEDGLSPYFNGSELVADASRRSRPPTRRQPMTYYGGKELAAAFRTVRDNTVKIAEEVPESRYDFRPAPDTRSVGETLAHIAVSTGFQTHVHGNKITDMQTLNFQELFQTFSAAETKPRTKAELVAFLKEEGEKFATFLEGLAESFLSEQVTMRPGGEPAARSRFEMLLSAKEHEMHHRGQLMTLQRMIGQVPHLTRLMQERMAAMIASQQQAQP